jgi:hypothetical protein
MSGCAQEGVQPAGAADIASPAPVAGAADGGTAAVGPCDPSVQPTATIVDSGACPGILPAAVTCAAELKLCNGTSSRAVAATSDGSGSLALSCANEAGPSRFNNLFVPVRSGFVSKMPLGVDVRPLSDGFVSSSRQSGSGFDFLAHDGTLRASQPPGFLLAGADGAVIVRLSGSTLQAQSLAADGTEKATVALASVTAPAGSLMLGGAVDAKGATLVIWQVYGESRAGARWVGAGGAAATPAFALEGWLDVIPPAAALAGGGIALASPPPSGDNQPRWRGVIPPLGTAEHPAPAWLASRGAFFPLPGGKAMAFGTEIVAADGTSCGTVDLGAPLAGVGVDGTAFTVLDATRFRLHPQLFR